MGNSSMREYPLSGVKTFDISKIPDERGFFAEILRIDWHDFIGDEWIEQANLSYSYPGVVRAWHRHLRGQIDYFLVIKGAMKICAYDDREGLPTSGKLVEIVASEHKLQVVRIPGIYWHGTKTVGSEPSITVYFVTKVYNYGDPDEERRPWNDQSIIDPKTNEPFDWNKPPHK
jgi:dTDP-4-dehydrorhamnose 3,5-epimerase